MISKLEKIEALLNEKKELNKYHLYSQILKNERTKRNMTLSEMSKGICSISYLCKFERNAIVADESYIRMIFERVHLDYDKVGMNIIEDGVKNILKAYLYNNYETIDNIFSEIDDSLFNSQNYLIKGFYFLIHEEYPNFNQVIACLDNIKETLYKEDIAVLMFLVVEYYIKTSQFSDAKTYLDYLNGKNFENQELNWLISEQHFIVGFHLKNYPIVYRYYYRLLANYNIGYPSHRQLIVRLMVLVLEAEEYFHEVYEEVKHLSVNTICESHSLDVLYWKYVIMLIGGLWVKVYDEIKSLVLYSDARFMCLMLYAADLTSDSDLMKEAAKLSEAHSFEDSDILHRKFIKFMHLKILSEKTFPVIEYLKNNIIPYNKTYTHPIYSKVYNQYYLDYLLKSSKYKEAYLYK